MMTALAVILWALLVSLTDSILFLIRHSAAKRRVRRDVFPPRATLAVSLSDEVPF